MAQPDVPIQNKSYYLDLLLSLTLEDKLLFETVQDALDFLKVCYAKDIMKIPDGELLLIIKGITIPEDASPAVRAVLETKLAKIEDVKVELINIVSNILMDVCDEMQKFVNGFTTVFDGNATTKANAIELALMLLNWHSYHIRVLAVGTILTSFKGGDAILGSLADVPDLPVATIQSVYKTVLEEVGTRSIKSQRKMFKAVVELASLHESIAQKPLFAVNPFRLPSTPDFPALPGAHSTRTLATQLRTALAHTAAGTQTSIWDSFITIHRGTSALPVRLLPTIKSLPGPQSLVPRTALATEPGRTDPITIDTDQSGPPAATEQPDQGTAARPTDRVSNVLTLLTKPDRTAAQDSALTDLVREVTAEDIMALRDRLSGKAALPDIFLTAPYIFSKPPSTADSVDEPLDTAAKKPESWEAAMAAMTNTQSAEIKRLSGMIEQLAAERNRAFDPYGSFLPDNQPGDRPGQTLPAAGLAPAAAPADPDYWPFADDRLKQAHGLLTELYDTCKLAGNPLAPLLKPQQLLPLPQYNATARAASTSSLTKAVHPPKFDNSDVNDFFERSELYYALTDTPKHQWIPIALLNIPQHNISKRWFAHAATQPSKVTWADFKVQVCIYARGHSAKAKALGSLATCTQGSDTVDKYITRYASLVNTAEQDCAAPHIIQGFLRGMADSTLRTMLTFAPDGTPWTSLLELQNQTSILAVSRYSNSDKPSQSAHTNKRKYRAGERDVTNYAPHTKAYNTTKASRALYHVQQAITNLGSELRQPGRNDKPNGGRGGSHGASGSGSGGRGGGGRGGGGRYHGKNRGGGGGRYAAYNGHGNTGYGNKRTFEETK
jgi:uncharacterized membrane protein YgcG